MGHFPVGSQINLQDRRKRNDSPPSASVLISSTLINVSHPKCPILNVGRRPQWDVLTTPNDSDICSDASQVEEFRARDASGGLKIAQVLEGFISRKVVKQTVMTVVYGVTRYGGRLQIEKRLKEIDEFPKVRQSWGNMNVPGGVLFLFLALGL